MNRQLWLRLRAATAGLSMALWLFMMAAEAFPALHAWMHGGSVPDNDDCAVVAVAHGKVEVVVADIPVVAFVPTVEIVLLPEFSVFHPVSLILPDSRGPPSFFVVS